MSCSVLYVSQRGRKNSNKWLCVLFLPKKTSSAAAWIGCVCKWKPELQVANVDTFEEGLTELLLRTRIVLNIHFYQARVLEMCAPGTPLGSLMTASHPPACHCMENLHKQRSQQCGSHRSPSDSITCARV